MTTDTNKYTTETVTLLRTWTPNLFTLRTTRQAAYRFAPGQFARLGVRKGDTIVWRAYSIVSATYDDYLEFYSVLVPGGEFTQQLATLQVGDTLLVDKTAFGFLTLERFQGGRDLWLLATGTGLAPYLSLLSDPATWERYERLILVHGARHRQELTYQDTIMHYADHPLLGDYAHKLCYIPALTRDQAPGCLQGRMTALIDSGELEAQAQVRLEAGASRIMLCGNPEMVDATRTLLAARGLPLARRGLGNVAVENYW